MTINLKNFENTLRELKSGGVRVVDEIATGAAKANSISRRNRLSAR